MSRIGPGQAVSYALLLALVACDRGSDDRADAEGAVVANTAESSLPSWLSPTNGTDPARWLAGREAGHALAADETRVRAMGAAVARARDGFIEDPRMIANRTVQLGRMLAEAGIREDYRAILDGLGGIAAERGRRKSLYGEMCQHYYNARSQGADHAGALVRLAAPRPVLGTEP
ncbi:MxaH protein [Methylobacterium sp. NEAU K]|uniref:MxaH protein n=1 Tax=Methylobacterium sp. NEAU K TaxID=3064946 RepID=UPI00273524B1|nr:MxaH protein [Methylobacterium sp. NEAU K]MDP4002094.1 MxaH protein [Methylobacterium sp. NEAU K]